MTTSPPSPRAKVSRSQAAAEMLRRRQARQSLESFTAYTKPDYTVHWHHRLLCRHLDQVIDGTIRRLLVFMPPRHGKSELVSRRLPAYALGRDPDLPMICCSHTSDLAAGMNRDVQRIIDNDAYRALFPDTELYGRNVRNASEFHWLRNSDMFEVVGRRGYYKSAGVGGAIAGRGFKLGIVDDPFKNREAADSPTQREAVWEWFTGDFMTRAEKDAAIVITHTRFHRDDLAGRLLEKAAASPKADQWTVLSLPAVKLATGHAEDPRELGEALWPDRKGRAEWDAMEAASPYEFWSQGQQDPRAPGGTEFPADYFGPWLWFTDWPQHYKLCVIALDPSKGKDAKHGDYSAFVVCLLTVDGTLWVDADMRADRDAKRIVADGIGHCVGWRPTAFAVEINAFQELLGALFLRAAADHKPPLTLPLYGITNTVSKAVRIRTLSPYLGQRRIRFKGDSPGARLLVLQLQDFPTGTHDDGPDALEMGVRTINWLLDPTNRGHGAPTVLRA